jgi:hypothetical protein
MHSTEVVPSKVQRDGCLQVFQLLAERIRKPRESAHLHPHREVLAFDVAGADVCGIGPSVADFGYNLRDWAWGVFFIPMLVKAWATRRPQNGREPGVPSPKSVPPPRCTSATGCRWLPLSTHHPQIRNLSID